MGSTLKGGNDTYNIRNFQEFKTERKRTLSFGFETLLPEYTSNLVLYTNLKAVKAAICNTCPYRLLFMLIHAHLQNV